MTDAERKSMNDYGGAPVKVGDLLLEDRGKVYKVIDEGHSKEGLPRVVEMRFRRGRWVQLKDETYARAYCCFVVAPEELTGNQTHDRATFWKMYRERAAASVGRRIAEHKAEVDRVRAFVREQTYLKGGTE